MNARDRRPQDRDEATRDRVSRAHDDATHSGRPVATTPARGFAWACAIDIMSDPFEALDGARSAMSAGHQRVEKADATADAIADGAAGDSISAKTLALRVLGTSALLLSLSCTGPKAAGPVSLTPLSDKGDWQAVLKEHTRRDEDYDWTIRQSDMRAALVTPKLRKAYLAHREEFQGAFAEDTQRELVALGEPDPGVGVESRPRPESEEQVIVFVAMYATDQKNRDIAASYTIWETTLERGQSKAEPIRIDTVKLSPAVQDVFPFVDRFDDLYIVRFPLQDASGRPFMTPGGDPLRLRIKSALADAVVEWSLSE